MLLLTDRPAEGRRLQAVLASVEPCTLVTLDQTPVTAFDHSVIVCDVALDHPAALAVTRAVLTLHRVPSTLPVLQLARRRGKAGMAQAQAIDASAVLPCTATHDQILFTVRRLVAAVLLPIGRSQPVDPVVQASAREATAAFADLFDGARRGQPITMAGLEQGGNAVIAAVAGDRIGAWLDVVRNYDDLTYQHCLLVAGLAAAFSARLGLSLKGQRLISQAALVHDIGKASVPQEILNKPGRLSATEMAVMRRHATDGHEMLVRQGGFDPQLLDIVRHHHEALDGSGYPDGLRGERVSALVRLVTICDIYAALIERRSYKPPIPPTQALAILDGMAGRLDTALLKAFHGVVGTRQGRPQVRGKAVHPV